MRKTPQEEVARLTDNIDYLQDVLESIWEWIEEYNRQNQEISYLQQKEILSLQKNLDDSEIKCLKYTKKVEVCRCVLCLDCIFIGFSTNIFVAKVYPFSSFVPNYKDNPPKSWWSTVEWSVNRYGYRVVDAAHTYGIHHSQHLDGL